MEEIRTRVLIVGGGMVGQSLGLALAHYGIDSVVVDRESPEIMVEPPFDGRASAIAAASWRMLQRLGVAEHIRDVQPIEDIRVSDGASPLFLHYDHRDLGDEPLGQMVENRYTRTALLDAIAANPLVRLVAPASVGRVRRGEAGVEASLSDGTVIRAELCAAADGRQSRLRAEAGIDTVEHRYGQDGIVCTIAHELPHDAIAHERFLPAGPFAILPLTGNRSSLVWTERSDLAPAFMELGDADFVAEIQRRVGGFLGGLEVVGPRFRYPLTLVLAKSFRARRMVLVGDAAHGIHPIAGQGFNLGLRDVAALAEVLGEAAPLGLDPGTDAVLERYEQWRRTDSLVLSAVTDGLNRLFSNDAVPVKIARDLGLGAVNRVKPLKKFFMRHAMGDVGDRPELLRP
ncbi:MAG: UbiH/UbiF/VisC/COQ6 family ubiquinone biosynthesis hydroxylase [Minwuia sp.]|uniref:UbiH/UbiF/VisC/COQ6 family ubiquinone biosynthesis hydroxylase n=1 Tax=Minwuia sp. TaxID=2493630 RepID=UPI003A855E2D